MNVSEDQTQATSEYHGSGQSAEETARELYRFAAAEMAAGHPDEAVIAMLVQRGVTADSAAEMIKPLRAAESLAASRAGTTNMIVGAASCIGGSAFTVASFYSAISGGTGVMVIAWGAIVVGGIQFVCGAIQRFL